MTRARAGWGSAVIRRRQDSQLYLRVVPVGVGYDDFVNDDERNLKAMSVFTSADGASGPGQVAARRHRRSHPLRPLDLRAAGAS